MQVILLERVEKLGQMGQIVNVRPGHARNYLIPQGKALRATKAALDAFETRRVELEADNLKRREDAIAVKTDVDGRCVVLIRQASETKHLYGSVSARDIAEAFTASGVVLDRRQVRIDAPIKSLGLFDVRVALHPEVDTVLQVNIARSQEEADIQAGKIAPPGEQDIDVESDDDGDAYEEGASFADVIEQELADATAERP